jgi:hypothetical protein
MRPRSRSTTPSQAGRASYLMGALTGCIRPARPERATQPPRHRRSVNYLPAECFLPVGPLGGVRNNTESRRAGFCYYYGRGRHSTPWWVSPMPSFRARAGRVRSAWRTSRRPGPIGAARAQ